MSSYQRAAGGQYILLAGPVHLTWDGRNEASHYIHEPGTNKLWPLADNNPHLSTSASPRTAVAWVTFWKIIFTSPSWASGPPAPSRQTVIPTSSTAFLTTAARCSPAGRPGTNGSSPRITKWSSRPDRMPTRHTA